MNEQGKFENTKWMKKESLKIPNELSEKVSRRRTVNTMVDNILHRKLGIDQHVHHLKRGPDGTL